MFDGARRIVSEKQGAVAVEYALLIALVGTAIAIASLALGEHIGNAFRGAANTIELF